MSTKPDTVADAGIFEVRVHGPGALTFGLFDAKGKALVVKRLIVSGPEGIEARSRLPRRVQTQSGAVAVVPVLMHRANSEQRVTFEGKDAAKATEERGRDIGLSKSALGKIKETTDLIAARGGDPQVLVAASKGPPAKKR
jgi:hypothetical protein